MSASSIPVSLPDLGPSPLRKPAIIVLGIVAVHPLAYWVTGNQGFLLLLLLVDPFLLYMAVHAGLVALAQLQVRHDRLKHYRRLGFSGDIVFLGGAGDFFAVSTAQRRLFADNQIHELDDIAGISWVDRGKFGSLEVEFIRGTRPVVRLAMASSFEAATAARRLQNLIDILPGH